MSEEDCDIALQTLIDNGIINVIPSGGWYQCLINYDSFKDFTYEITDLFDKEDIKLSTDVTFKTSKVDCVLNAINNLSDSEKEEMIKKLRNEHD